MRRVGFCFSLYCLLLIGITQLSTHGSDSTTLHLNLVPLAGILRSLRGGSYLIIVNLIGNIVVFMPFGAGCAWLWPKLAQRPWQIVALGIGFSLALELGQLLYGVRVADIDDVLLNGMGTWLGWLIWQRQARWLQV